MSLTPLACEWTDGAVLATSGVDMLACIAGAYVGRVHLMCVCACPLLAVPVCQGAQLKVAWLRLVAVAGHGLDP